MLHARPYNEGWTADINAAYISRDAEFFKRQVQELVAVVAARDANHDGGKYDAVDSRLLICLALYDFFARGGETLGLLLDVVNF